MSSRYYQPGQDRAPRVQSLFAAIARRYDILNDLMSAGLHRHWKNRLVRAAQAGPADRVLDLCCGTGDLAFRLARQGGVVCGLDFTRAMLHVAQRRPGAAGVRWVQGDALRLPFPDATFDVVTVGFGLRNLADLPAGLGEARRVLKLGGRFLSLDFGKPARPAWRWLYFSYLRTALPVLGWLFHRDADTYRYVLVSLENYAGQMGVAKLLAEAGFADCRVADYWGGAMALNSARVPPAHSGKSATSR